MGNLGPLDPLTLKPLQCFSIRCDGGAGVQNDQIAPDTIDPREPAEPDDRRRREFIFNGSDNASTVEFQCSLDSAAVGPLHLARRPTRPTVGSHTFQVRAVDLSGNVDLTPASYTWWMNEPPPDVPPAITFNATPDLTTVRTDATFEFSANERGSTFQCKLDTRRLRLPARRRRRYTGLAVGTHTFTVRATDLQGDFADAAYAWRITPAPVPAEIVCGEVIVRSILVQNDLIDCPGNALIVGTHNITIDLNGHFIDGIGIENGIVNNGFDSVTITNGTINEFDYGVLLGPGTSLNIVTDLRLDLNQEAGIALADADQNGKGNTIRRNTLVDNGYGIALFSNTRFAHVHDNALGANNEGRHLPGVRQRQPGSRTTRSPLSGGNSITMIGGGNNTVIDNTLRAGPRLRHRRRRGAAALQRQPHRSATTMHGRQGRHQRHRLQPAP